jgi:hypothetical protein
MGTVKTFCSSLLVMIVCLAGTSCKGAERNITPVSDTSIIAASKQAFTIGTDKPFYQVALLSSGKKLSADKKILLLLDDTKVLNNPDGVYEVYVSGETTDVKMLSSSHPAFVNLLDLYALTANDPPKFLSVDLKGKLTALVKDGQLLSPITLTILFRGNMLPDNTESKQAGRMMVKGVRVIQE